MKEEEEPLLGGNQVQPQAAAERIAMPVNPIGLTDAKVQTALAQITQAIIFKA